MGLLNLPDSIQMHFIIVVEVVHFGPIKKEKLALLTCD